MTFLCPPDVILIMDDIIHNDVDCASNDSNSNSIVVIISLFYEDFLNCKLHLVNFEK